MLIGIGCGPLKPLLCALFASVPEAGGKQPLWTTVQDAGLTAFAGTLFNGW